MKPIIITKRIITRGGLNFFAALTLLLVALKLTGYADISWLWIVASFFGPWVVFAALLVFGAVLFCLFFAVAFACAFITGCLRGRRTSHANLRRRSRISK